MRLFSPELKLLAVETIPDQDHLSDIEGMLFVDSSSFYKNVHAVIVSGKFEGDRFPVANEARIEVRPPYEDFNPSLMSADELTDIWVFLHNSANW